MKKIFFVFIFVLFFTLSFINAETHIFIGNVSKIENESHNTLRSIGIDISHKFILHEDLSLILFIRTEILDRPFKPLLRSWQYKSNKIGFKWIIQNNFEIVWEHYSRHKYWQVTEFDNLEIRFKL